MSLISPRLPWEVIERVIEHAHDDFEVLDSFSLTCRQLRPRSFALIIARYVYLDSRDRILAFSDFIQKEHKLQPLVQSISISPADFRPFPLVHMLPHLSTLLFTSPGYRNGDDRWKLPPIKLHTTMLRSYYLFGRRIHTLSLDHLSFQTSSDLFRLLLAFPMTTQLSCNNIFIKFTEKQTPTVVRNKLSKQLRLQNLHVRIHS